MSFVASPCKLRRAGYLPQIAILSIVLTLGSSKIWSQASAGGGFVTPSADTTTSPSAPQSLGGPFSGSIVQVKPTPGVVQLTIKEAIEMGLKYNLGLILSSTQNETVRGQRYKALAELLPNLSGRLTESVQQVSLAQFGFPTTFNGGKEVIGPFAYFDARASLTQNVFDYSAIQNFHISQENIKSAKLDYQNARDLVVLVSGASYLQAVASAARVDAAQAELTTANTVYKQAVDRKAAGVVPAIEVLRAQVQMQAQQQRLLAAKNEFARSKLSLARVIGMPTSQEYALADKIPYAPLPPVTFDQELQRAYANRSDYKAAEARVHSAELARKAAVGERLPVLRINSDYGLIGPHPDKSNGTFTAMGGLIIPIFQGGRARGDIIRADAEVKQRQSELDNLRGQIEYDLRTAFLDIQTAADEIDVATSTLKLAHDQLQQSEDRFAAGVTDNLEVVQAQQAVAVADENYISSLYAHNYAKLSLVRAVGVAETAVMNYLGGK